MLLRSNIVVHNVLMYMWFGCWEGHVCVGSNPFGGKKKLWGLVCCYCLLLFVIVVEVGLSICY